jgi:hypothetical protein
MRAATVLSVVAGQHVGMLSISLALTKSTFIKRAATG